MIAYGLRRSCHLFGSIYKRAQGHQAFDGASVLMLIWLCGLLIGVGWTYVQISKRTSALIGVCNICFATPLKYLLVVLPFLFSAIAVVYSRPKLMFLICGIKAVCVAADCILLCYSCGQAGWLAYWLYMFSDVCSLPFLYFYWIRNLSEGHQAKRRDYSFILPVLTLIIVDYRIVLPYAMRFGFN